MAIKIFLCGDLGIFSDNPNPVDSGLIDKINRCDLRIGNLEAPCSVPAKPISKAGPCISQSKSSIKTLSDIGFNVFSLANNHIYDFGIDGLNETLGLLDALSIKHVGAGPNFEQAHKPLIIELGGVRIGILSACEAEFGCLTHPAENLGGGYAWINSYRFKSEIVNLRKKVDYVCLLAHAGIEGINVPLPEWRCIYRELCDLGANFIVGTHPHVPQGVEKYKDSYIFYSLGNFYFDYANSANDDSYSIVLELAKDSPPAIEYLFHKTIDGQVKEVLPNQLNFSLEVLNQILLDQFVYKKTVDDIAQKLFNEVYTRYLCSSLNTTSSKVSIQRNLYYLFRKIFMPGYKKKERDLLLLHLFRVESHRFLIERSLNG